jgi:hypothetical protein
MLSSKVSDPQSFPNQLFGYVYDVPRHLTNKQVEQAFKDQAITCSVQIKRVAESE